MGGCADTGARTTIGMSGKFLLFFVSNHNFACIKEHPRMAQLGFICNLKIVTQTIASFMRNNLQGHWQKGLGQLSKL